MDSKLTKYYEQELNALHQLSQEFAKKYPKIAGRLLVESDGGSADPHVERLLQGFSFLSARIQKKIQDSFPEITDAFLEILYPHFLRPIPSYTILSFDLQDGDSPLTEKYEIEKSTSVLSKKIQGFSCQFQTVYPTTLWPLKIAEASLKPVGHSPFKGSRDDTVATLNIKLESINGVDISQLDLKQLRFFIDAEESASFDLYEIIMNNISGGKVSYNLLDNTEETLFITQKNIQPVGFGPDEGCLQYDKRSFLGYRLLQEYFAYPEKFLFFDLNGFKKPSHKQKCQSIEITLFINEFERKNRLNELSKVFTDQTLKLHCTPAINIFKQRCEPIQLSQTKTEYRIRPERRWPLGMEVYSVDEISRVRRIRGYDDIQDIPPLFNIKNGIENRDTETFWYSHRRTSFRENDPGSETYLSLIDHNLTPESPTDDILTVEVTCTNRDMPENLKIGSPDGDFEFEVGDPVSTIRALRKPSKSLRPDLGKDGYWRLISHLSLNHLSLVEDGREALLEILNLYNFSKSIAKRQEILGILSINSEKTIQPVGPPHRRAFCQGTHIKLYLDEERFVGSGAYMFGAILNRFFGLYTSANCFTQLTITTKQRERELKKWQPILGDNPLL